MVCNILYKATQYTGGKKKEKNRKHDLFARENTLNRDQLPDKPDIRVG